MVGILTPKEKSIGLLLAARGERENVVGRRWVDCAKGIRRRVMRVRSEVCILVFKDRMCRECNARRGD